MKFDYIGKMEQPVAKGTVAASVDFAAVNQNGKNNKRKKKWSTYFVEQKEVCRELSVTILGA